MTPEDKLLFACTRQHFHSVHQQTVIELCNRQQMRWENIWTIAREHSVAPLVYTNLKRCALPAPGIPAEIAAAFNQHLFESIARREHSAQKVAETLALFAEMGIDVMLIKGAALNLSVYEHAWYTYSEDADLVLHATREAIAPAQNARLEAVLGALNRARNVFKEHIEYDYFKHHDVTMNGVLPVDFEEIWDEAQQVEFKGHKVYVMSPEDTLITACISSCRKRFFRLKMICDIRETVGKMPTLDWERVIHKARKFRCNNIVYTALLVTNLTLGCELPFGLLNELNVNPFRAMRIEILARTLVQRFPLSALSPYTGKTLFGRKLGLSLVLPYATYRLDQIVKKLRTL